MLIMRHELLLIAITVILLLVEIFLPGDKKSRVITLAILLMTAVLILGFVPGPSGTLFGGMYQTTALISMLKNILNIGALIVMIQSADWLRKPENKEKISEYYILLLSTLIGMQYMLSSGDFLMFYLGLELATIPLAALAAFERFKEKSAEAGVKFIFSSALSSGILLYGLSMIYGTTGTLYFAEVGPAFTGTPLQVLGFIFFFAGMAFKISLVPFRSLDGRRLRRSPCKYLFLSFGCFKGGRCLHFNDSSVHRVQQDRTDVEQCTLYNYNIDDHDGEPLCHPPAKP